MCISGKGTSDKLKTAPRLTFSQTNNNRAQQEDPSSIVFPTFREEHLRSLDVSSLTQSELAKLKTEDPFMYFSIPAVRIAELSGNDVDAPLAGTVSRMQRITAEAYPDIVVEDIVNNASLMERIVQEVRNEMEQEQRKAKEDDEEEEEDGANDEMIQRYFNLLSENF